MTLKPSDQQRIIANESAWVDSAFGGLDLSAFPSLNELPPANSKDDDRFARHWSDTPFNAGELRSFIENPDLDAMTETGSADLLRDVRDREAERIVREFKQRVPEYLPTHENYHSMVVTLAFNALPESERNADDDDLVDIFVERGYWTPGNLEAVYRALDDQGILDRPASEPRNLTERERLRVARMAQAGRIDEAIGEYLRCALDGDEPSMELVNDPRFRQLCDDAVLTVFEETQLDYVPTASRKAYLLRFAGKRSLTIPLLREAWKSCQASEQRNERNAVLNRIDNPQPEPVSAKQIDALDDSAVDRLYHDSLRAYAESIRRARECLRKAKSSPTQGAILKAGEPLSSSSKARGGGSLPRILCLDTGASQACSEVVTAYLAVKPGGARRDQTHYDAETQAAPRTSVHDRPRDD